jgi:hypothetical protein
MAGSYLPSQSGGGRELVGGGEVEGHGQGWCLFILAVTIHGEQSLSVNQQLQLGMLTSSGWIDPIGWGGLSQRVHQSREHGATASPAIVRWSLAETQLHEDINQTRGEIDNSVVYHTINAHRRAGQGMQLVEGISGWYSHSDKKWIYPKVGFRSGLAAARDWGFQKKKHRW